MNETFKLYDLNNLKTVGSDIVTPWIDGLLSENIEEFPEAEKPTRVLVYPVENLLTPATSVVCAVSKPGFSIEPRQDTVRIISSISAVTTKIDGEKEIGYFTFASGDSLYALPALSINEIIKYKKPVSIFSKKQGHLGVILYRNRMVPIYDFSMIVSMHINDRVALSYTIICIYKNKFFGLSVDRIKDIMKIKNKHLISSSTFKFKTSNSMLLDVFQDEEKKIYSIIDLESVFNHLTS
ncbi:chemotaxis protein CheW [Candidatus Acidulodesulfobacterium sp. H_13]|uniref:chemotaxis protein CheW n=1 Tax=Candidatus Acidulodesulfobacterium sp. H_13 TaxID=3395470 RepID=UPI003AF8EA7A